MASGAAHQEILRVGRDRVVVTSDRVIIDALYEMPEWQVREFQRFPIFVGEYKFFLGQIIPAAQPYAMRYVLERWPEDAQFDAAPFALTYDEQFVQERDAEHLDSGRVEKFSQLLMPLYPVLGFLWAGTKQKLVPFGFVPRSITSVSIFTGLLLMVLQGTFVRMRVGLFTLVFGSMHKLEFGLLLLDYAVFALLLVDMVLRFDQHLKAVENPWGFCEWMAKPFRKKSAEEEDNF